MKEAGRHVSLNYFVLPGFTDTNDEFNALCELIDTCHPDLIQLRNLNMDPEMYIRAIQHQPDEKVMGIRHWHAQLNNRFPHLKFGYFNPALK